MALIVAERVVGLLNAHPERRALFVAACVERVAQLFTGRVGSTGGRDADVDLYVGALDGLWEGTSHAELTSWSARLVDLPESDPGTEIVDGEEIASAFAVNVLRDAIEYRLSDDLEWALMCAHDCLTLAGLVDRNVPGQQWKAEELAAQEASAGHDPDAHALRAEGAAVARRRRHAVVAQRG